MAWEASCFGGVTGSIRCPDGALPTGSAPLSSSTTPNPFLTEHSFTPTHPPPLNPMEIAVVHEGTAVNECVLAGCEDSVAWLKAKAAELTGLHQSRIDLELDGELLGDADTDDTGSTEHATNTRLADTAIGAGSVVTVVLRPYATMLCPLHYQCRLRPRALSLSPCGRWCFASLDTRAVEVLHTERGEAVPNLTLALPGDGNQPQGVACAEGFASLFVGGTGGLYEVSLDDGAILRTLCAGKVPRVKLAARSAFVAAKVVDSGVWRMRIFNVVSGEQEGEWKPHDGGQFSFALTSDATRVVTRGRNDVRVWTRDGAMLREVLLERVSCVDVSLCTQYIAVGAKSGLVCIVDTETGDMVTELQGHKKGVRRVAFSTCGKYLLSGARGNNDDFEVYVWNVATWELMHTKLASYHFVLAPCSTKLVYRDSSERGIRIEELWS